jgi:transcriptional regulator with XRE-family HTH domain
MNPIPISFFAWLSTFKDLHGLGISKVEFKMCCHVEKYFTSEGVYLLETKISNDYRLPNRSDLFFPFCYYTFAYSAVFKQKSILSDMNTGKIIVRLREQKNWNQSDLAGASSVSRVMICKYESGEAVPSIDSAKKIADAFEVSLDYLVGEGQNSKSDKKTLKRLDDLEALEEEKKKTLVDLIDTYIRDAKARKAYA